VVGQVIINTFNSTDSDLLIVATCNGEELTLKDDEKNIPRAKEAQVRLQSIEEYLDNAK